MAGKAEADKKKDNDITKMSKEQLQIFAAKLMEELERQKEERSFFQNERDNMQTFWDITRQQLNECKTNNRILRKEQQDYSKKFEEETIENRKKLAHVIHTTYNDSATSNIEHLVALKKAQSQYYQKKIEITTNNVNNLNIEKEVNLNQINQTHSLKLEQGKTIENMKNEYKQDCIDIQNKYDDKVMKYHQQFSLKHNLEMAEVEERKNEHMSQLTKDHAVAFEELKSFYNNILMNNLAVINNLKKKLSYVKSNELKLMIKLKECRKAYH